MLVVEDTKTNEIQRFFMVDSSIELGTLKIGEHVRTFDLDRALAYFQLVENQLHDFSLRYQDSFRYLPHKPIGKMKRPPILSEIYQGATESAKSSWLVDQFISSALISVGSMILPTPQQKQNMQLAHTWATTPPHSLRLYFKQEMRYGLRSEPGWGCVINGDDLRDSLQGQNRNDLMNYTATGQPVFVELGSIGDLENINEWAIALKSRGIITNQILCVKNHKEWGNDLFRLLDIPGSKIITSGSTISSLSDLINYAKAGPDSHNWASKFVFGSAYPATSAGDSISEILSFLLSRSLDAKPREIQKILAGNILSLIHPKPPFLQYKENRGTVVAENHLGQDALAELSRILQLLSARETHNAISIDYMLGDDGGRIDLNSAILSVKEVSSNSGTGLVLLVERDETLRVAAWRNNFAESIMSRRWDLMATLVRDASKSDGPVLNSPAHMTRFIQALLNCIQVKNPSDVVSALHFRAQIVDTGTGILQMAPQDMRALNVNTGEIVLVLVPSSDQWWPARVEEQPDCSSKIVGICDDDAALMGIEDHAIVGLVKYRGPIAKLDNAIFAFEPIVLSPYAEAVSFMYLHGHWLRRKLDGRLIGRGTRLRIGGKNREFAVTLVGSLPELEVGEIGTIVANGVEFHPSQIFKPMNVVLCMSTARNMSVEDIQLKTIHSVMRKLLPLYDVVPELDTILSNLRPVISRSRMSVLAALLLVQGFRVNKTDGRFSFLTYSGQVEEFEVTRDGRSNPYAEFANDLTSDTVLASLVHSILNADHQLGGNSSTGRAIQSITDILDKLESIRPTLVLMFTSNLEEDGKDMRPMLDALSSRGGFYLDILGLGTDFDDARARTIFEGINSRIIPIEVFSAQIFEGYIIGAVERMFSAQTN